MGYEVKGGALIIGAIKIGRNCYIGTRSVVSHGSELGDNSSLGELSLLQTGLIIPKNEHWEGSPATKNEDPKIGKFKTSKKPKALPFSGLYVFPVYRNPDTFFTPTCINSTVCNYIL